jgi:hypothetical protein
MIRSGAATTITAKRSDFAMDRAAVISRYKMHVQFRMGQN